MIWLRSAGARLSGWRRCAPVPDEAMLDVRAIVPDRHTAVACFSEGPVPRDMMPASRVTPRRVGTARLARSMDRGCGIEPRTASPGSSSADACLPTKVQQVAAEAEILALLLSATISSDKAERLAGALIRSLGDLCAVAAASDQRLLRVEGMTPEACRQLRAAEAFARRMGQTRVLNRDVLHSWEDLIRYCRMIMVHQETEHFHVFFLDRRNAVIADETLARGTIDQVAVYPREVARRALDRNASSIILAHNHPSGDPTPSLVDIAMTGQVARACGAIGVTVQDHIVIGHDAEVSFRDEGFL